MWLSQSTCLTTPIRPPSPRRASHRALPPFSSPPLILFLQPSTPSTVHPSYFSFVCPLSHLSFAFLPPFSPSFPDCSCCHSFITTLFLPLPCFHSSVPRIYPLPFYLYGLSPRSFSPSPLPPLIYFSTVWQIHVNKTKKILWCSVYETISSLLTYIYPSFVTCIYYFKNVASVNKWT